MHRLQQSLKIEAFVAGNSTAMAVADATHDDLAIIFVNKAFSDLTGYADDAIIGRNCRILQGPQTDRAAVAELRDAVRRRVPVRRELLNYRRDGTAFWVEMTLDPFFDRRGNLKYILSTHRDVTAKHEAMDHMLQSREQLSAVAKILPGHLFQIIVDAAGCISFEDVHSKAEIFDKPAFRSTGFAADLERHLGAENRQRLLRLLSEAQGSSAPASLEFRVTIPSQGERCFRVTSSCRRAQNDGWVYDAIAIDITVEKSSATQLAYISGHDVLTGLINRQRLKTLAELAIAKLGSDASKVVLFHIELDDFDAMNDTFGEEFGDSVLRRVGVRLTEFAIKHGASAARIGLCEFGLLFPCVNETWNLSATATAVLELLGQMLSFDGHQVRLRPFIGNASVSHRSVGPAGSPAEQASVLLRRGHLAAQAAKLDGPGACVAYLPGYEDRVRSRVVLRQSLEQAIADQQFDLFFQPLVDLRTAAIIGAEALVRWNHPKLGILKPDEFIPVAESTGLIVPLGHWIVGAAMRQWKRWAGRGLAVPRIAINISPMQLRKPDFVQTLERLLAETGVCAEGFEFELTESVLVACSSEIMSALEAIRSMGFRVSIDDFGTGQSSLRYLRDFSFDTIKIDQSFVRPLTRDSADASIINAIIGLSQSLNLGVVAEGVETQFQCDFLCDLGCGIGQGYLFSPPVSAEAFAALLRRGVGRQTPERRMGAM